MRRFDPRPPSQDVGARAADEGVVTVATADPAVAEAAAHEVGAAGSATRLIR